MMISESNFEIHTKEQIKHFDTLGQAHAFVADNSDKILTIIFNGVVFYSTPTEKIHGK